MIPGDSTLTTLSPLDGRYKTTTDVLRPLFSEYALNKFRIETEIKYLFFFAEKILNKPFTKKQQATLLTVLDNFDYDTALTLKQQEKKIKHDVKAVEYYLRDYCVKHQLPHHEYIHFGLTSEDTNSIAYALALRNGLNIVIIPAIEKILTQLSKMAERDADLPLLARTHGQPAVPTTLGKEWVTFALRLHQEVGLLKIRPHPAKLTGAVGNHNALTAAFPEIDWPTVSNNFIESLDLTPQPFTSQILPGEHYASLFHNLERCNAILLDLNQDCWRYISDNYFLQKNEKSAVGSSTMPHKINPIQFENSEGNLGIANALFQHFAQKLPISRLQRDLSDSTVKRNFGAAFGYSLIGYENCLQGLQSLTPNYEQLNQELETHWEVVTEGIQTILKTTGDATAYEKLKKASRGKKVTEKSLSKYIDSLEIPATIKQRLLALTPHTYLGQATHLVSIGLSKLKEDYVN